VGSQLGCTFAAVLKPECGRERCLAVPDRLYIQQGGHCHSSCLTVPWGARLCLGTALGDLEMLVTLGAKLQEGISMGSHCATSVLRSLPGPGNHQGYNTNT